MGDLVNEERVARGLRPLDPLPKLAEIARRHSRSMAATGEPSHDAGGTSIDRRIREVYPEACRLGENISKHINIDYALADLLASAGHRDNLLSRSYTGMGIGIVRARGFLYITQDFIQICGKP